MLKRAESQTNASANTNASENIPLEPCERAPSREKTRPARLPPHTSVQATNRANSPERRPSYGEPGKLEQESQNAVELSKINLAVREELGRILASKTFAKADRLRPLLQLVINRWLTNKADQLDEYNLASALLERNESFDPGIDPTIRVYASRLREHLERYYAEEGASDPVRIDIPKGGYVPKIHCDPSGRNRKIAPDHPQWYGIVILPFLVPDKQRTPNRSYAVVIVDHLIRLLTCTSGIRVLSRFASTHLKEDVSPGYIERRLGAKFIVEGTLASSAEGPQLIVHLSEAASGYNLWSTYYDVSVSRIADLATEVANDLTHVIRQAGASSHRYSSTSVQSTDSSGLL